MSLKQELLGAFPPRHSYYVTIHAMARYAQRVLERDVTESDLMFDPGLQGRLRRGVMRLLHAVEVIVERDGTSGQRYFIAGQRCAVVLRSGEVVTVLRTRSKHPFRRLYRARQRILGLRGMGFHQRRTPTKRPAVPSPKCSFPSMALRREIRRELQREWSA